MDAAGAFDAALKPLAVAPASVLVEVSAGRTRVLAVGTPEEVDRHPAKAQAVAGLPGHVLTPAFVNAHAHLDLTHIGPQPRSSFATFVDLVRSRRLIEADAIRDSVLLGARLSIAGGVAAVGDIAGAVRGAASIEPYLALRESQLSGVSFCEFFAMGESVPRALARVDDVAKSAGALPPSRIRFGLQPHAPYSVSLSGYRHALARAEQGHLPIATHLAESIEERAFIAEATGPQRRLLEALGLWNDSLLAEFGLGKTPVAHLASVLRDRSTPMLLVHLNDLSDADVGLLCELNARVPIHVAYCPRSSEFFGASEVFGPHRYRELLAAGINVCLGTDSILNLPEGHACGDKGRISPLDDARLLRRRDATPPSTLLEMLTVRGARALGLEPSRLTLAPGAEIEGICALEISAPGERTSANPGDLLRRAFASETAPTRLF